MGTQAVAAAAVSHGAAAVAAESPRVYRASLPNPQFTDSTNSSTLPFLRALSGGYVGRAGPARQLSEAAPQALRRKRGAGTAAVAVAGVEEVAEKTVERRQKRMIKNRESAARSRARKQAYTHELENKVSRLEEENERLKRQKELEPVIHFVPQPEPKHQLRRTSSALF
uniref:BZIP domain-containing protein n=1 Tax=Ananas comosus var. bracteatus TaxID=296719 RepID=A0A6V7PDR7_ANACO|nr:unnamed protein product [Ananas comosus var. bracteatus]